MTDCANNQRQTALATAKNIVIKVGSAVITDPEGLNCEVITSLATQIAALAGERRITLVTSGSVAAGKAALRSGGIDHFANYGRARHAIAAIGQGLLMAAWNDAFSPFGILTGQVLLTREDLRSRHRFLIAATTFSEMFTWGAIPVVNENDTVSVIGLNFGDNDSLASLLVNLVEADLFVNLTSAPGVFEANPEDNPNAKPLSCITDINNLDIDAICGAKTEMGSGGMRSKLIAARRVAQLGVPTLILPGRKKKALKNAFMGKEETGTWVAAVKKTVPRRKFWLAYQSEPEGIVEVDRGAAEALLYEGRSLLPGGIVAIKGDFTKDALVRVTHEGKAIGAGFCNYDSETLKKIRGLKRHEVAAILGKARYPDAIHRDNLLLDAAL